MPDLSVVDWVCNVEVLGLPTKTPLVVSHFLGRQCSSWRVLLQVCRTRFSGRALLLYLFLLVRILLWFRHLFRIDIVWFRASCVDMSGWCPSSRILLHLSFQIRRAHSNRVIRKRCVAPL